MTKLCSVTFPDMSPTEWHMLSLVSKKLWGKLFLMTIWICIIHNLSFLETTWTIGVHQNVSIPLTPFKLLSIRCMGFFVIHHINVYYSKQLLLLTSIILDLIRLCLNYLISFKLYEKSNIFLSMHALILPGRKITAINKASKAFCAAIYI